ncbi:methylated-DNA--[protein]-cysteine S-methyltransferase [Enemella sp. A6]|uniref:methylated-DNA--[protein]-cysteine S-methyltransferase n=1 Tax=Enemella sp. A6 TaxID=3440152 RepID=UPI003EBA8594
MTSTAPRHLVIDTELGEYVIAADGEAITGVWRRDQAYFPKAERLGEPADDALLQRAAAQLREYLAGTREEFDLPIAPRGTPFQHRVWDALLRIPRGHTTTYGALAAELGSPLGAQAVGRAVGTNPISIIVPCHRVVSATGELTGYAGGTDTKAALLRLEGTKS